MEQQLGKYVLDELIAVGGMAEIYRAHTVGLGGVEKILAIKRLHEQYCSDRDFVEMLVDEARIAVQLNHKNIGQVFDLEEESGAYFIAMEYISGRDLFQFIRRFAERGEAMPLAAAVYIAEEICSGLSYAHRRTDAHGEPLYIIHRDISPQNILISFEGEVKIVDFGIAKAAKRASFTQSGVIKGKFHYMSPEQARGDRVDQRADIFSVGAILYEMVTGQMLYQGGEDARLLQLVRRADFPPPSAVSPDIPHQLEQIILKALSRDLRQRFQSARDMQLALSAFARDIGSHFDSVMLSEVILDLFRGEARKSGVMRVPKELPGSSRELMRDRDFQRAESSLVAPSPLQQGGLPPPLPADDEESPTNLYGFNQLLEDAAGAPAGRASGQFKRASLPSAPRAVSVEVQDRAKENTKITGKIPTRQRGANRNTAPPTLLFLAAIFGVLLLAWAFIFATNQLVGGDTDEEPKGPRLQKAGGASVANSYEILSDPMGAQIWLDGEDTGLTTPASLEDMPEGAHTVTLKMTHHEDAARDIHVEDGGRLEVELVPLEGILKIDTSPTGARIHVDGKDEGTSPVNLDGRRMRDTHQVAASLEGYKDAVRTVRWQNEEKVLEVRIPLVPLELRYGDALDALLVGARNHVIGAVAEGESAPSEVEETSRPRRSSTSSGRHKSSRRHSGGGKTSKGLVSVNSKPPGKLYLNGKFTGKTTPVRGMTVSSGYHRIKVCYDSKDHCTGQKRALVKPGAEVKLFFSDK